MTNLAETIYDTDAIMSDTNMTQHLSFEMGGEVYAINVLRVQEIKGWDAPTEIPDSPKFVMGVINIRGAIVPVFDLRVRFGMNKLSYEPTTVVIVTKVIYEEGERIVGLVVDGVSDVLFVDQSKIKSAPEFGSVVDNQYVTGLIDVNGAMVVLVDIDHLYATGILPEIRISEDGS
ncbi:MAG: chemotaxis protein CheW [bacterium]